MMKLLNPIHIQCHLNKANKYTFLYNTADKLNSVIKTRKPQNANQTKIWKLLSVHLMISLCQGLNYNNK